MVIHDFGVYTLGPYFKKPPLKMTTSSSAKSQNSTDCALHFSAPGLWSTSSIGEPASAAPDGATRSSQRFYWLHEDMTCHQKLGRYLRELKENLDTAWRRWFPASGSNIVHKKNCEILWRYILTKHTKPPHQPTSHGRLPTVTTRTGSGYASPAIARSP